jgi:hypothetical protein
MASGFTVSGRGDLDTLFLARVGAARANVGFTVGGVDLANRYEPIGTASPIAATGFRSGGTDLANLFRDINASLGPSVTVGQIRVDRFDGGGPAELHFNSNGNVFHREGSTTTFMGSWSNGAPAADYQVRFVVLTGTLQSGSNNVWESLSTTRSWAKGAALGTMQEVTFYVEFRRASDLVVVETQTGGYLRCDRS